MMRNRLDRPPSIGSLRKGIEVLFLFSEAEPALRLGEIAERLRLPKSTASRFASTLREVGLLTQDRETRRYQLGTRLLALQPALLRAARDLPALARPLLRSLTEESGETAHLTERRGPVAIITELVESRHVLRMAPRRGETVPLHAGALARTILAFLPPAEIERILRHRRLERLAPGTPVALSTLRRALAEVRHLGYAVTLEEINAGACGVAAPSWALTAGRSAALACPARCPGSRQSGAGSSSTPSAGPRGSCPSSSDTVRSLLPRQPGRRPQADRRAVRSAYLRFCDALAAASRVVVMILMAAMTVDCLLGVFFRYVVQDALTWTEETARYLMIWMGFLATGLALREGGHIALEVVLARVPPGLQRVMLTLVHLLSLAFLVAVIGAGWLLLLRVSGQRTPVLGISMMWPYLAIPVGCLLTALEVVALTLRLPAEAAAEAPESRALTRGTVG